MSVFLGEGFLFNKGVVIEENRPNSLLKLAMSPWIV